MKYNFQTYSPQEANMNNPLFFVCSNRTNEYSHFIIRPVWKQEDGRICFYNHASEAILEGFKITCQWNIFAGVNEDHLKTPYAWRTEYDSRLDQNSLGAFQQKINFLEKIEKGIAKISKELGRPETFESYVAYVANVMSINSFVFEFDGGVEHDVATTMLKIKNIYKGK